MNVAAPARRPIAPASQDRVRRLVMLHGFTGSGESLDVLRQHLPADWPVICPDLVGHGGAAHLEDASLEDWTYAQEVERIATFLRESRQEIGTTHLFGYSLGARVGLGLLASHPGLFDSATLVGVHPGLESEAEKQQRIEADEKWAVLLEQEGVAAFVDRWDQLDLFASQRRLEKSVLERQREIRSRQSASGLARAMRCLSLGRMPSHRPTLSRLQCPLTLVVGALDEKFLGLARSAMESSSPSAADLALEVVEDVGHNVVLEAPETLAAIVHKTVTKVQPVRDG